MDDILLIPDLRRRGLAGDEVRALVRARELVHVRRGAYALPGPDEESTTLEWRHRRLVSATVAQLGAGAVVSHGSAAVLHGLPVWSRTIARVHVTRDRSHGAKRRGVVEVHAAPLGRDDVTVLDGVAVTTLARTTADLARTLPHPQAVAVADAALAQGLNRDELDATAASMSHWPGVRQARRVLAFADARSESPGESVSRVLIDARLPTPELQQDIADPRGKVVARVDFRWPGHRTVGEFDGKHKYGRLLLPGQPPGDVVYAEKRREDKIRDLGEQVVRWVWDELDTFEVVVDRLLRAFERSR